MKTEHHITPTNKTKLNMCVSLVQSSFLARLWCQHSLNGGYYGSGWYRLLQEDVAMILASVTNHKCKVISAGMRWGRGKYFVNYNTFAP